VPAPGRSDLDDGAPRYQLLGYLASGGMAELYFARVVGLAGFERHVVLKRIVAHHARDPEFVAMFLDEARLAAQLHHPNIAQVFDIGRMVDSYFFTMEYIHGESARALFRRCVAQQRTMPLHLVLTVVAGAAAGLHYAHEKRSPDEVPLAIVHRDVSPSNVMIGFDGAVKVVDFGIARAVTRSVETRSGVVRGKLGYMAPEQCKGEPLDRRCDVFALGIMLFELATMTRLYEAESEHGIIEALASEAPRPSARRPELPAALDAIVARALARRREDRYPTAAELILDLEQLAAQERRTMSPLALGAFMRDVFGARPEPWAELRAAADATGTGERLASAPTPTPPADGLWGSWQGALEGWLAAGGDGATAAARPDASPHPTAPTVHRPGAISAPPSRRRRWRWGVAALAAGVMLAVTTRYVTRDAPARALANETGAAVTPPAPRPSPASATLEPPRVAPTASATDAVAPAPAKGAPRRRRANAAKPAHDCGDPDGLYPPCD